MNALELEFTGSYRKIKPIIFIERSSYEIYIH